MATSDQNKGQRGDWQELQGVNIKFYIQDDKDTFDNHAQENANWLKWFGGSNLYSYYNGFNPQTSFITSTIDWEDMWPGEGWLESVWMIREGNPDGLTRYADHTLFNYNLGGFYCKLNEGSGNFLKNAKNVSSLYRRTSQGNSSPSETWIRTNANQSNWGNGIMDVYGEGIRWGSDNLKNYIEIQGNTISQDTSNLDNTYDSAALSGFLVGMMPNTYELKSTNWWKAGNIQEANKYGNFNPACQPSVGESPVKASYPDGQGGMSNALFKRPSGFRGINFHMWLEVPSPSTLFGYDPNTITTQQDSSTLFCLYNQYGDTCYDPNAANAAALQFKNGNILGHNLVFGFVRQGDQIQLTMTAPMSRDLCFESFGMQQNETFATAIFEEATKKIFSSYDTVDYRSTKSGGLHHIQFQWLGPSNEVGVWIDGEYCPAEFYGANRLHGTQLAYAQYGDSTTLHAWNSIDGINSYQVETTIANQAGWRKMDVWNWSTNRLNTSFLISDTIRINKEAQYEASFELLHDGVEADNTMAWVWRVDGVDHVQNFSWEKIGNGTDANGNQHIKVTQQWYGETSGALSASKNNIRPMHMRQPLTGGWAGGADSVTWLAVRNINIRKSPAKDPGNGIDNTDRWGKGARLSQPGWCLANMTYGEQDSVGNYGRYDLCYLGGQQNLFFIGSIPISGTVSVPVLSASDPYNPGYPNLWTGSSNAWGELDTATRFTNHFKGKIYDFAAYGVPFSFTKTNHPKDSNDAMKKIYALGMGNIPRKPEYVDFSDQFEMKGKNLLESIGTIKQVLQGEAGQFFVQLNSVTARNVD